MTTNHATDSIAQGAFLVCERLLNFGALLGLLYIAMEPSLGSMAFFVSFSNFTDQLFFYLYFLHLLFAAIHLRSIGKFCSGHFFDLIFFGPLFLLNFRGMQSTHILLIRQGLTLFSHYLRSYTLGHLADSIAKRPARLVFTSFFGVIVLGAFILVLPISVAPGQEPSLLSSLFTSTSAVCVTGLAVEDTGRYFSVFGQVALLVLIQIGGLGLMTMSAGISLMAGKRMGMTHTSMMQEMLDVSDLSSLRNALKDIFRWAFLIELAGACILGIRVYMVSQCSVADAVYSGIFHSISAFCNAGFSIYSDNLVGFNGDPIINFTIMGLIITGGLGFMVLSSLNLYCCGARNHRLNTHAWLVIVVSLILILVGAVVIFFLEHESPCMSSLPLGDKLMAALFQSVSTRTAGFNTIDFTSLKTSTLFFMSFLMFIGASPGSTGGGIKTTTFATLCMFVVAKLRGQSQVSIRGRRIPDETILKAFLIVAISTVLVAVFVFLLILTEDHQLIQLIFEAISAFATVGLSTGITPILSIPGKLLIVALMFIGRIGPLTMALSITAQETRINIQYPETRVLVG
ncbi:MAG TPA: TrkH family potassium uptake protein [Candidatus Rifleibacterium sp.]|nr:TrkH family potassium uptake protein [Candidatus Rifleibacterium sp.]HPT46399.1 TrkH family potassium uptake protein [Candidatus Rifleibacterium sp.]